MEEENENLINKINVIDISNMTKTKFFLLILPLLCLIGQALILYYMYEANMKINEFIIGFNKTDLENYIVKIEKLVDMVCKTQNIC
jgi:hypothetical protein